MGTWSAVGVVVTAVGPSVRRVLADGTVTLDGVLGSIHPLLQSALALAWLVPSIVLVRRRGGLPFGWLGLSAASAHGLAMAAGPADEWAQWAALWLIVMEVPVLGALVQLFPTGRPVEGWGRYLVVSMV